MFEAITALPPAPGKILLTRGLLLGAVIAVPTDGVAERVHTHAAHG